LLKKVFLKAGWKVFFPGFPGPKTRLRSSRERLIFEERKALLLHIQANSKTFAVPAP